MVGTAWYNLPLTCQLVGAKDKRGYSEADRDLRRAQAEDTHGRCGGRRSPLRRSRGHRRGEGCVGEGVLPASGVGGGGDKGARSARFGHVHTCHVLETGTNKTAATNSNILNECIASLLRQKRRNQNACSVRIETPRAVENPLKHTVRMYCNRDGQVETPAVFGNKPRVRWKNRAARGQGGPPRFYQARHRCLARGGLDKPSAAAAATEHGHERLRELGGHSASADEHADELHGHSEGVQHLDKPGARREGERVEVRGRGTGRGQRRRQERGGCIVNTTIPRLLRVQQYF